MINKKVKTFSNTQLLMSLVRINEFAQIMVKTERNVHNQGLDLKGILSFEIAFVNAMLDLFFRLKCL